MSAEPAQPNLAIALSRNADNKTVMSHRYMAYPLSVSRVFRPEEPEKSNRAYLYRTNTSPGLLAGDALRMSLQLAPDTQLYLTDQSATKVHAMPSLTTQATVDYRIEVGDRATLEFLPEPLILFADSALRQSTEVVLSSTSSLILGEIILPGRLARGESYEFRQYLSRLRVKSSEGTLWFAETMKLLGRKNRFADSPLFSSEKVLGSLVLILPRAIATATNLSTLSTELDEIAQRDFSSIDAASSVLPTDRGLFVRAMAPTASSLQSYFKSTVNSVRRLRKEAPIPYSFQQ